MPSAEAISPFRILIVGGGIAGLASAIALRGPNRSILILEQSALNREIGATISLQPNASKIVEKQWGLYDALKARGSMIDEAFTIVTTQGVVQAKIDLKAKKEYGGDRVIYHRQDLHETLKEAATSKDGIGEPAGIRVSSRVMSCDCENGSVKLENGQILDGFDLVIGADGIRSKIRGSILGREVHSIPTGSSAYRMMMPTETLENEPEIMKFLDPRKPTTTMVMGNKCRLIMGPARNGSVYSIVAMIPDEHMNEDSSSKSWTSTGDLKSLLESFRDFPDWCKRLFLHAPEIGLWQLRDMDPLDCWVNGRAIIIGDACHAMLPTQGQGASQSIEDAEALGALFANITSQPSQETINTILKDVEETRKPRTTKIQLISRESAKPATDRGSTQVKMKADEHMDFNCMYDGARDWQRRQREAVMAG